MQIRSPIPEYMSHSSNMPTLHQLDVKFVTKKFVTKINYVTFYFHLEGQR